MSKNVRMIFDLDANATYTPSERVRSLSIEGWNVLGNPSSLHRRGQRARAALEEAREAVRLLAGAGARDTIVFTSGATEANNTVVAVALRSGEGPLVASAVEHPCVLQPLMRAAEHGRSIVLLKPNSSGELEVSQLDKVVPSDATLVSVMAANNETGVKNDIMGLNARCRTLAPHALLHTDAAQVLGKEPVHFSSLGVDILTFSGHKIGALPGVGAIVVREGVDFDALLLGGPQEHKLRAGTENVLGIISLAVAARECLETLPARAHAMQAVRDRFEMLLRSALPDCQIHGQAALRLPNTSSVAFPGIRGDDLVVALDLAGVLVSSGAACSSGKPEPSHVLAAMGLSDELVRASVRFSFRADQDISVADAVVEIVVQAVSRMRSASVRSAV
jgi:cysteine desulfurase